MRNISLSESATQFFNGIEKNVEVSTEFPILPEWAKHKSAPLTFEVVKRISPEDEKKAPRILYVGNSGLMLMISDKPEIHFNPEGRILSDEEDFSNEEKLRNLGVFLVAIYELAEYIRTNNISLNNGEDLVINGFMTHGVKGVIEKLLPREDKSIIDISSEKIEDTDFAFKLNFSRLLEALGSGDLENSHFGKLVKRFNKKFDTEKPLPEMVNPIFLYKDGTGYSNIF